MPFCVFMLFGLMKQIRYISWFSLSIGQHTKEEAQQTLVAKIIDRSACCTVSHQCRKPDLFLHVFFGCHIQPDYFVMGTFTVLDVQWTLTGVRIQFIVYVRPRLKLYRKVLMWVPLCLRLNGKNDVRHPFYDIQCTGYPFGVICIQLSHL